MLSRYDLGAIESITPFEKGSSRSPKVGIVSENGKFLLKKRAAPRNTPKRVAFTHDIQRFLEPTGFPLPKLSPNRVDGERCVTLGDDVFELFAFVSGHGYGHEPEQACEAGRVLSAFHKLLVEFEAPANPPMTTYHDVIGVRTALNGIPSAVSSHDSVGGDEAELLGVIQRLYSEYEAAGERVNDLGFAALPMQIIHADWHPGNLLFKRDRVVAVLDYDSCRLAPRVIDVANGALQFSMRTSSDPDRWPEDVDRASFVAFLAGYAEFAALSSVELKAITPLMVEAIVAESAHPIAQTGAFGTWPGFRCLRMVARKVIWMVEHEALLLEWIEEGMEVGGERRRRHVEAQQARRWDQGV